MVENQLHESEDALLNDIVSTPYKYGFTTDIEIEDFEKGLNLEIVRKISHKKDEPAFLLKFREKAFASWTKMTNPAWAYLKIPEIDYESIQKQRRSWVV